tara:strand:+ start:2880 stop:3062 length:183 start_codon:yes stop_codon:yes gene_type:complete
MNTNKKIFQAFNVKGCNEVKEENKFTPRITAINNADRRRLFDHFNEALYNRIIDIKNNRL